jgi:type I restriction enzyme, S subunit
MADIANLLTEHMDIWTAADAEKKSGRGRASGNAGSVYGVKKLRVLILELAVRGKLVPQDPNEEPASKLLKRIQGEKDKLVAEGKLKKEKPLAPIGKDEKPFELPNGWEFVRLETISDINGGFAFKSTSYTEDGVRVIRISDFDEKGFKDDKIVRYKYSSDLEQYRLAPKNILMAMTGGTVGKCYLVKELLEDMVVNQRVATIKLMSFVLPEYISNVLQTSSVQNVIQAAKNSTNDNISMLDIKEFFIPMPSLSEQHRIVAKVDELMALCDQLEQKHSNTQEAHEILVSQLLATLTQSKSAAEFNANWQRIYAYFDVLFTTDASIDALKQTLLQLAVMGKLVPQDTNDEPASELLKRIQAEKAQLIVEGKLKKEKPHALISEDEKPFEMPIGWSWTKLTDTAFFQEGPGILAKDFRESGVPLIRIAGMRNWFVSLEGCNFLDEDMVNKKWAHFKIELGDIILSSSASLGKVAKVSIDTVGSIVYTGLIRFRPHTCLNADYLILFLNSNEFLSQINKSKTGAAIMHFGPTHLKEMQVPLPPLSEQHRIVAKVDALMALCDQLKTRIQQANQQQKAIGDALVAQGLKPATDEIIDLAAYRAAITCNIIKRMQHNQAFGRTFAMKLLYLSQQHIGLETHLQFEREAAGPFDKWIYDFERDGIAAGWFVKEEMQLSNGYTKIEYQVKSAIDEPLALMNSVGNTEQRKELERLFALFADKKTEEAEIVATLFASWNDFLFVGVSPTDDQIIQEVRENWHPAKAKFSPEQLMQWLGWLRDNKIIPTGKGTKTVYQKSLIH